MPRRDYLVLPGVPHFIRLRLDPISAQPNRVLDLLGRASGRCGLSVAGYCLLPGRLDVIGMPAAVESVAEILGRLARRGWSVRPHVNPLDPALCWAALAYIERGPVRAGILAYPAGYPWSSAGPRLGVQCAPTWLALEEWRRAWTPEEWRFRLADGSHDETIRAELHRGGSSGMPMVPPMVLRAAV